MSDHKRALGTRDPDEARQRYNSHVVVYEQRLPAARRSLASKQHRSAPAMVDASLDSLRERQPQVWQTRVGLANGAHGHGLDINTASTSLADRAMLDGMLTFAVLADGHAGMSDELAIGIAGSDVVR